MRKNDEGSKLEKIARSSIHTFIALRHITNDQGDPLDFVSHAFLSDFYDDWSPVIALRKAAQLGWSTALNIKSFYLAKYRHLDIIYSLPTTHDVQDFVAGKTNRLIANNPIFQEWTKDKDSIEQKKVGRNVIYYRGTWGERQALATPADLYISDETDRSKQDIVSQFETRLQHSKYGWKWYVSNPSLPGIGVDAHWAKSDQKHWMVRCDECGFEWYLTMENIIQPKNKEPFFGCTACHRPLYRKSGRWVKARPEIKDISGYWISLLAAPWISASRILEMQREYSPQQFANFVLGEPYATRGNKLSELSFFQNLVSAVNPQNKRPIIGVDTGVGINLVMGNEYGLFYYSKSDSYDELESLLNRWKDAVAIIDQGGDIIGPRKLKEKYPHRVFLCFFGQDRKNDEMIKWNDSDQTVIADRNKMIQLVVDEFSEKRIPLYGTREDWQDVWNEWAGMYRTEKLNVLSVPVQHWNKPTVGRCDYPFAIVYWRIGMSRFMNESVTFQGGNEIDIPLGIEPNVTGNFFFPKK